MNCIFMAQASPVFCPQNNLKDQMPVFVSYAQNFEDVMLWRALGDVKNGFYVDVGAADPDEETVTRAFYDRGWSGINIEPLDEYFDKLKRRRTRDVNLKVAAGRKARVRTLHCFAGTGLSTLDPEISARHETEGRSAQHVSVSTLTLSEILLERAPAVIHFLKIDVEGAEAEVLEGLDLRRFRPWIIVIEATKPNSTEINANRWEHLVVQHRYDFAYFDGLNCFYVADEKAELKQRLKNPPNVFDCFLRWTEAVKVQKIAELEEELRSRKDVTDTRIGELQAALQSEQAHVGELQAALQSEQAHVGELQAALQSEQAHVGELQAALQGEQAHVGELHAALQGEQVHVGELRTALHEEQARFSDVISRLEDLRAQVAHPSLDRLVGRMLKRISHLARCFKK
jgi:FkbM family methyltransferase